MFLSDSETFNIFVIIIIIFSNDNKRILIKKKTVWKYKKKILNIWYNIKLLFFIIYKMERHPTNTEKKEKGQLITIIWEYEAKNPKTNLSTLGREEKSALKEDDKSSDTSINE